MAWHLLPLLLIGVLTGAAIATAVYWNDIVSWFQSRKSLKNANRHNVEYTLVERLDSGNYGVQYGIFNTHTEEVIDRECIECKTIDRELARIHADSELVFYE